jgi:uncharacterized protein YndB with AHSA1/START domain
MSSPFVRRGMRRSVGHGQWRTLSIMAVLRLTQVIDRPPAEVFRAVTDLESFPQWNPTTKSATKVSPGETGEGSTFELRIRGFGTTTQELRNFERDRRVTLVPHIKAMGGGHTFVLTPEEGRTRVDHELEMSPRGAFKLLGPMMTAMGKRNLRATADALKRWVERPGSSV